MSTVRLGFQLFDSIRFHTATPSHPLSSYKRSGSRPTYALVTGGSAGIGNGIAEELVRNGFGVILLGHLADEVEASAARLRALAGNDSVSTIILDAKVATPEEIGAAIENTITSRELQLSILVNNVGSNPVAHPPFRPLASYSAHDIDAVINLNSRFMARLTAVVLPILSKRDHQDKTSDEAESQRSLILNIASGGMYGSPWLVIYGATKAFNWAFSNSLAMELEAQRETQNVHCFGKGAAALAADLPKGIWRGGP
ncbi:short-chain dehydrogenase [Colletotrichum kahawae]|uniref:Short-chain dehydrogenase n=1 Tax=Colletotrichum kahawae TaxID=34407 RepID=A0AAD9YVQ0_COLKA|nr:short-chain dehydrogenase [Colletotrichum kahawae]